MPSQPRLKTILFFLFWSVLFSVAYTQSPLYSSNQNTYFLQGFRCAGIGQLTHDWLANTRDATPLFSALVCLTLRFGRFDALFYIYYGLIFGVYFYALMKIAGHLLDLSDPLRKALVIAGLFLVHAAGFRFLLIHTLGPAWGYVLEDGFAGQRMLGSVFEPSVFAVFLLLAFSLALDGRYVWAVVTACAAAWFHPTYLLGTAALTTGILVIIWFDSSIETNPGHANRRTRLLLLTGMAALAAALPAIWISTGFLTGVDLQTAEKARQILVNIRIPHHALVAEWLNLSALIKLVMIMTAIILARRSRLFWLLILPALIALVLTLLQWGSQNTALALLFPWRISVYLLPVSLTLLLGRGIDTLARHVPPNRLARLLTISAYGLVGFTVLVGAVRLVLDFRRKAAIPEKALFSYVAAHLEPSQQYLIPLKLQDFRLATGAPAYIDFKSNPYLADEVLEWYRRLKLADNFYLHPDCSALASFRSEQITQIVLPAASTIECPELQLQFQDENYRLFALASP